MIGVEITGTQELISDFKGYEKEAEQAINKAVTDTAKAIETDAKRRLQGQLGSKRHWITGNLAKSIYNRIVQSMEKVVGTKLPYAPYIEFGTGDFVDIPEGAEGVASLFRGKGIRKVNIKGDSFLNWAAVNQRQKLVERIKANLNKINR
jgi:hypothetical protein